MSRLPTLWVTCRQFTPFSTLSTHSLNCLLIRQLGLQSAYQAVTPTLLPLLQPLSTHNVETPTFKGEYTYIQHTHTHTHTQTLVQSPVAFKGEYTHIHTHTHTHKHILCGQLSQPQIDLGSDTCRNVGINVMLNWSLVKLDDNKQSKT